MALDGHVDGVTGVDTDLVQLLKTVHSKTTTADGGSGGGGNTKLDFIIDINVYERQEICKILLFLHLYRCNIALINATSSIDKKY